MARTKLFRRLFYKLAPKWLTTGEGELVLFSLGTTLDAFAERARQGALASMPSYAPDDALAPLGRDRRFVRGINESSESYAARMLSWLDDHQTRGSPFTLMKILRGYCNVDMMFRTVDVHGNWFTRDVDGTESFVLRQGNWAWEADDPNLDRWSRFWVILYPPASLWVPGPTWGDPELWGGAWGTKGYTWGSTATPDEVKSIRSIVREWKPDGTTCVNVIVAFDAASFDPSTPAGPPLPDGTWYRKAKVSGGTYVASRLSTARYWRGTS